ncbi:DgaE family pyridoxal phosphate-dependent ammonia lyase [Miniphocaeibacter halophilus]|uniref:DgaE family pyridoxal phosphate-dependent ammonia lyase n=1 Tax=Miniphocaeibacter halophilus TaxID=2931922 RepID=UPI001FB457A0|nr:DgaE family pyridoxal phosphate-dependent ammonia lyase [Miniphocaeibacter halophilus]
MDIFKKYDLKKVINASGKMTILGVSKVSDKVAEMQKIAGQNFFEMEDLKIKIGKYIANLLEVEAATVVSSASAGIVQSVAALIGKGDNYHLMHPYTDRIEKREIVIPKGHNVNYGTSVELMIEQGGGIVVEAGYSNQCSAEQVEMQITDNTAALMYIKSHHSVQKSILSVSDMITVSRKYSIPLIVDAAAEEDLNLYYNLGADIVIYSGAKGIEGPSSGLLVGKNPYIQWVQAQSNGIGRSMKIGKDNIFGITVALEEYVKNGTETGESQKNRLNPFVENLNNIKGIKATIVQDGAGRDIFRAKVEIGSDKISAKKIVDLLKTGEVAIYTREYNVNNGIIEFDIRSVNQEEMDIIYKRLKNIMEDCVHE